MSRLISYLLRYRWRYVAGGACLLGTASLAMTVPYLLKRAINAIEQGQPASRVATFAAAIIAVAVVQGFIRTFSRFMIFNAGRDVEFDLRNDLFAHLLRLPAGWYLNQRTGDLMSRLVNDVTAVRMLLGPGILNLVNTPVYYVYAVSIMLSLDTRLTLVALAPYQVLLWVVKRYSRHLMEQTVRVQAGLADLSSRVQENISGITAAKAYVRHEYEEAKFTAINDAFAADSLKLADTRARMMPVMKLAASLGTLAVLWYGGSHVIQGTLSLGDLVAFIGYLNLLAWPTMALGWMISILQRGRAAMQRLDEILTVDPSITDPPDVRANGSIRGTVEWRDVDFAYGANGAGRAILREVSLRVGEGEKLAIVGRTGSGKTTLLNLLPRIFDTTGGQVLVGGHDARSLPLQTLRSCFAFVPQDPFLFSATIRDNIAFAVDVADDEVVHRAAEAAGVAEDISAFPAGYDTFVGERGITLSGGQRQRLTLARALVADAPILVLDDALSSVDTRTEQRILHHLRSLRAGRTTITVAHRMSAVQDADVIVVVDDGKVADVGTHGELMRRQGLYADLFQRQMLEEELEEL